MNAPGTPQGKPGPKVDTVVEPTQEDVVAQTAAANKNVFACEEAKSLAPAKRLRRLTGEQVAKTVAALLGGRSPDRNRQPKFSESLNIPFADVNNQDTFTTRSSSYFVSATDMEKVFDLSDEVARKYVQKLPEIEKACLLDPARASACVAKHVALTHELVIGKPLPKADETAMLAKFETLAQVGAPAEAFIFVLRAILVRPTAYLIDEAGDASGAMDSFAIARSISYTLTNGPPDKILWAAAQTGNLTNASELKQQILRLLAEPATMPPVRQLFLEWFHYAEVTTTIKDTTGLSSYNAPAIFGDTDAFLNNVLANHSASNAFENVMTNEQVYADFQTRELYGVTTGEKYAKRGLILPPVSRPGLLAQPSWLIAYSDFDENKPMKRAKFVLERLLCASLPEIVIPDFPPVEKGDNATLREKFAVHTKSPACQTCHEFMDPLAFAFEGFDDLGRHRTQESGKPIDARGTLVFTDLKDPSYDGLQDMTNKLVGTTRFQQCAVRHAWEFFVGRKPETGDGCAVQKAYESYQASKGNLREFVASMLANELLAKRRAD